MNLKNFPKKLDSKTSSVRVRVPDNLDLALEGLIRKVLREQPKVGDIYAFAANYFETLLQIRDKAGLKEPVDPICPFHNDEDAHEMIKLASTFPKPPVLKVITPRRPVKRTENNKKDSEKETSPKVTKIDEIDKENNLEKRKESRKGSDKRAKPKSVEGKGKAVKEVKKAVPSGKVVTKATPIAPIASNVEKKEHEEESKKTSEREKQEVKEEESSLVDEDEFLKSDPIKELVEKELMSQMSVKDTSSDQTLIATDTKTKEEQPTEEDAKTSESAEELKKSDTADGKDDETPETHNNDDELCTVVDKFNVIPIEQGKEGVSDESKVEAEVEKTTEKTDEESKQEMTERADNSLEKTGEEAQEKEDTDEKLGEKEVDHETVDRAKDEDSISKEVTEVTEVKERPSAEAGSVTEEKSQNQESKEVIEVKDTTEVEAESKKVEAESKEMEIESKKVEAESKEMEIESKKVEAEIKEMDAESKEAEGEAIKEREEKRNVREEETTKKGSENEDSVIETVPNTEKTDKKAIKPETDEPSATNKEQLPPSTNTITDIQKPTEQAAEVKKDEGAEIQLPNDKDKDKLEEEASPPKEKQEEKPEDKIESKASEAVEEAATEKSSTVEENLEKKVENDVETQEEKTTEQVLPSDSKTADVGEETVTDAQTKNIEETLDKETNIEEGSSQDDKITVEEMKKEEADKQETEVESKPADEIPMTEKVEGESSKDNESSEQIKPEKTPEEPKEKEINPNTDQKPDAEKTEDVATSAEAVDKSHEDKAKTSEGSQNKGKLERAEAVEELTKEKEKSEAESAEEPAGKGESVKSKAEDEEEEQAKEEEKTQTSAIKEEDQKTEDKSEIPEQEKLSETQTDTEKRADNIEAEDDRADQVDIKSVEPKVESVESNKLTEEKVPDKPPSEDEKKPQRESSQEAKVVPETQEEEKGKINEETDKKAEEKDDDETIEKQQTVTKKEESKDTKPEEATAEVEKDLAEDTTDKSAEAPEEELCTVVDTHNEIKVEVDKAEQPVQDGVPEEGVLIKTITTHYYDLLQVPETVTKEYKVHHTKEDALLAGDLGGSAYGGLQVPTNNNTETRAFLEEVKLDPASLGFNVDDVDTGTPKSDSFLMTPTSVSSMAVSDMSPLTLSEMFLDSERRYSSLEKDEITYSGTDEKRLEDLEEGENNMKEVEEVIEKTIVPSPVGAVPVQPREAEEINAEGNIEQAETTKGDNDKEKPEREASNESDGPATSDSDSKNGKSVDSDMPIMSVEVTTVIETQMLDEDEEDKVDEQVRRHTLLTEDSVDVEVEIKATIADEKETEIRETVTINKEYPSVSAVETPDKKSEQNDKKSSSDEVKSSSNDTGKSSMSTASQITVKEASSVESTVSSAATEIKRPDTGRSLLRSTKPNLLSSQSLDSGKKNPLLKTRSLSTFRQGVTDFEVWNAIEKELEDAATKIQSKYRGYTARKKLQREDAVQIPTTEESSTSSTPIEQEPKEEPQRSTGEFHDSIVLSIHPR